MTIYCIRSLAKSPDHVINFGTNRRASVAPGDRLGVASHFQRRQAALVQRPSLKPGKSQQSLQNVLF